MPGLKTSLQAVRKGSSLLPVQFHDVILKLVDAGAHRERDADGADDRFAAVEGLDLDLASVLM